MQATPSLRTPTATQNETVRRGNRKVAASMGRGLKDLAFPRDPAANPEHDYPDSYNKRASPADAITHHSGPSLPALSEGNDECTSWHCDLQHLPAEPNEMPIGLVTLPPDLEFIRSRHRSDSLVCRCIYPLAFLRIRLAW